MREPRNLNIRRTRLMYFISDHVNDEVISPKEISDWVFPDFLENKNLEDLHERLAKPQKNTLLHSFIFNLTDFTNDYVIKKAVEVECDYFRTLISNADLTIPSWLNENEVSHHKGELSNTCKTALRVILPSVFHILFSDRIFLFEFQQRIAKYVKTLTMEQYPRLLKADGVVHRSTYYPSWLQRAIFYRDQGRCQLCFCEISGLSSPNIKVHLDHMVPLAAGGSNDPTNFQLACESCNTSKGKRELVSPARFEPYW
ncbi:HNH endonuclease [Acetobacter fallax]|uniref:HNH nuclease domain-containing protein n=1 Tax=Acetobacter fallax TaxID=1737473 RepID=A0ABX0KDJ5_9PROT|nr:HNH endonuclease signature motif containing protein [Acetobacter fallax]NHO33732.1 hypothetical protein [Acetobacter fallax]NHO37293.1 hypothetical protein [Acetobacter fallax]